mgnify:FL=1
MKEFTSTIKIEFSFNNLEAENKEEYIEKLNNQFYEDFNMYLSDCEITQIESN